MGSCQSQTILNETHHELLPQKMEEDLDQPRDSQNPPVQYETIEIYQKENHMLLKKLDNHFPFQPNIQVRNICYIPEKNLLLAITKNYLHVENLPDNAFRVEHMVNIYNTMRNFNLVAARRSESEIYTIIYSKELGRILTGGDFLQIWSLKTFQIEAESEKLKSHLSRVLYNPSSDLIVTFEGLTRPPFIGVYNRNLVCLYQIPIDFPGDNITEMMIISNDLLLCVINLANTPTVYLVNLERKTKKTYDDKILIPEDSCIAMTGETPNKIFTCLTCPYEKYNKVKKDLNQYSLTQFTIDEKTEELVISRMTEDASFLRLLKSENGKFLIAEKFRSGQLLNIKGNKVEVICFISGIVRDLGRFKAQNFIVLKDELSIVIMGAGTGLRLCKVKVEKAKKKEIEGLWSQNGFWCV